MQFRIKNIIVAALISFGSHSYAQENSALVKKNLKLGEDAYERSDFLNAFNYFAVVLKHDTANYDVLFKSGVCLLSINKTDTTSIKYFIKSASIVPEAHFYLGKIYQLRGQTKKAVEELYFFKSVNTEETIENTEVNTLIKNCESALREESKKGNYIVKNLGAKINSQYPEYVPLVWSANGSLIFTSRRADSKGGLKDPYGRFYEDIYIAQNIKEGWGQPVSFSEDVNTQTHDACVAFSPDGTELIIYRTDEKQTGGDLYISKYDGTKWSTPQIMGTEINSEYLEASACFSGDGDEIIFSSNRPGGLGGKDLYRVRKFMNGKYSLPFNLGPTINTPYDEDAPFIDKFDNTLYFSSKGHNSIGEYDIFKSEFNTETNRWMKPENLGMPINSTNDDIYFMKLEDKETAFFSSRREGGFGDADIYQINLNESSQLVIYCRIVYSGLEKSDLKDFQLSMYDNETGKLEGLYKPNKEYMTMVLVASANKSYKLVIESSNIEPVIKNVAFTENDKEYEIDVERKVK